MQHLNIFISGRVQGVFYRDTMRQKARELGVTGFVMNKPDGSVYAEAEGETDAAALSRHAPAWDIAILPAGSKGLPTGIAESLTGYPIR